MFYLQLISRKNDELIFMLFFQISAPLINDAVERYERREDHLAHKEMLWEVAHRITMLEKERETLSRQINDMKARPNLWV